jgi:selenocysteine lyase/cysteine desulfurase
MPSLKDLPTLDPLELRARIVGADAPIDTPFGERLLTYCDYTASGRCLDFVEHYLMRIEESYANTHTEDDVTGRSMTRLLQEAEEAIKASVNAGPRGRIIATGTGSTGAIWKFQQIVGVALPPATRRLLFTLMGDLVDGSDEDALRSVLRDRQPLVIVGPYEHHSNEVSWREGLATVVETRLSEDGGVDLDHLEELLDRHAGSGRTLIGSFSACSNVTGMKTPVHEVARRLHRYGALACFDYAASAPYVTIDMNPEPGPEGGDPSLDAVFLSPHKFLGGPGSSGILVFDEAVYDTSLPPSVGAGGTVAYVSHAGHDYLGDVEAREKAGTPGVFQTMKAALAMLVKGAVGEDVIEERERELIGRAITRWESNPHIEILGNPEPERRIAICSFNVREPEGPYLHPKLVTTLLNDLFGIQSRAGCSCAGPYGHDLLGIGEEESERYREWILKGYDGIKPGWCRVGFHYTMDDAEADYVIDAVDFVADHGWSFLQLYRFDLETGQWEHRECEVSGPPFSLDAALDAASPAPHLTVAERAGRYARYLAEARELARDLETGTPPERVELEGPLRPLQYFVCTVGALTRPASPHEGPREVSGS